MVWPKSTAVLAFIVCGLDLLVTPAMTLTHVYTDGNIRVLWQLTQLPASTKSVYNKVNVQHCEFGVNENQTLTPSVVVFQVDTKTVSKYIKECEAMFTTSLHRHKRSYDFKAIYPGTKWCGTGNIAGNYNDLGRLSQVDRCCRQHDNCHDSLKPGQQRGGLTNNRLIPMFPCSCEETFRKCLQSVRNFHANTIGFTYFTLLHNRCYVVKRGVSGETLTEKFGRPYEACLKSGFFGDLFNSDECT